MLSWSWMFLEPLVNSLLLLIHLSIRDMVLESAEASCPESWGQQAHILLLAPYNLPVKLLRVTNSLKGVIGVRE